MRKYAIGALAFVVFTAMAVIVTTNIPPQTGERVPDALSYGCIVVAGAGLLLLAHAPRIAVVVAVASAVVYASRGYPGGPIYAAQVLALFAYTLATDRRQGMVAAVAIVFGAAAVRLLFAGGEDLVNLPLAAACAIAVLAADAVRARAERRRHALEAAQRQRAEERLRLARDLHDSVAHAMAAINVQAGVAAHVIERDPARAAAALDAIRISSRDVLEELAALLDVLRDDEAPRAPVADLTQIDSLLQGSELAGVEVTLRQTGAVESIPHAVSIAAYRIVQEALTNVARHSGAERAEVTIDATGQRVKIEVIDRGGITKAPRPGTFPCALNARPRMNGSGATESGMAGGGRGIPGIRERVAGSGGRVEIGPRPSGGFAVRAEWPA